MAQRFIQNAAAAARTEAEEGPREEASSEAKTGAYADVDEVDVKLVVNQVGCTPEEARAALKAHNNDIVETILKLSC